jgi:hypothetical protein
MKTFKVLLVLLFALLLSVNLQADNKANHSPEGGILLSGDCSDYIDLSGEPLPIEGTGSTIGASNNYGPLPERPDCWVGPWYQGSCGGADETYKWTAPDEGWYSFSLCGSTYDTGLLLYDFTCPDEPVYPDDFICGNDDAGCVLGSHLDYIYATAGQEFLIVADGFSSAWGQYVLTIQTCDEPPPPLVCPDEAIQAQCGYGPDESWQVHQSDISMVYCAIDNIPDLSEPLCEIHFWGFDTYYNNGWYPCTEDSMEFKIEFYYDNGSGQPDYLQPVYEFQSQSIVTFTDTYYGAAPLNYYEVVLDSCVMVDGKWISIQGFSYGGDPQNCQFLWLGSEDGDRRCFLLNTLTHDLYEFPHDLSMCLIGAAPSIEEEQTEKLQPSDFLISKNYPNPFNDQTVINYSVGGQANVKIEIFDMMGKLVEVLLDENQQPGTYRITWDAQGFPSGTYFYKIKAGAYVEIKKMVLMK